MSELPDLGTHAFPSGMEPKMGINIVDVRIRNDWKLAALLISEAVLSGCQGTGRFVTHSRPAAAHSRLASAEQQTVVRVVNKSTRDDATDENSSPPSGRGERPAELKELLTLSELEQLALARNPTLQQAEGLLQQARGNWVQVGLYPNPVVGYSGGANNQPFDAQMAFVSQNIVTAGKLALNRDVATCDVERAQWELQAQHLRVMNEIQMRYVAVLGAQRQIAVTEELLNYAEESVRITEQLLEAEQVARVDVLQARLQRSQTQLLVQNSRYRAEAAWKQLGNAIGWPDLPVRPLEGQLEDAVPDVEWEAAWQQLSSGSPQLLAARARASAARAQVQREMVQPTPDLQLMGSVGRDFAAPQFMMYGLQIGVALPIFDRNQGNITAAQAELVTAEAEVRRLELSLRDRLSLCYQRYETASNEVAIYREMMLPTAESNLKLTQLGYEGGELDFLRVLTARRDLTEAIVNFVRALTDLRIAIIEIQGMVLTGGLDAIEFTATPSNSAGRTTGPGF